MYKFFVFSSILFVTLAISDDICDEYITSTHPIKTIEALKKTHTPKDQFCIGAMYFKGKGIEHNTTKAFSWVKKSSDNNYLPAKSALGGFYINGNGVGINKEKGFNLLLESAKQNSSSAQYNLAVMYFHGDYVNRNIIESIKWLKQSELNGNKDASKKLIDILPQICWMSTNKSFKIALYLIDAKGNKFPNKTINMKHPIMSMDNNLTAAIYFENCKQNIQETCTEYANISLFDPNWQSVMEVNNIALLKTKKVKYNQKNQLQVSDIAFNLSSDPEDIKGNYHLLITIYDSDNKLKSELNQVIVIR